MGHRIDELPSITTPSDSDKIVVEHDSLTSQITLARLIAAERNRLNQLESALQSMGDGALYMSFLNTSTLTSQVDALPTIGTYFGSIGSYGHQSETGMPDNSDFYIKAQRTSSTGYSKIEAWSVNNVESKHYITSKVGGSWGSWTQIPSRAEIDSINNSFANSLTSSDLISFTPLVGASYGNYGNCYYFKKGNQVHVHVGMSGLTANARNSVFTLPSGYRPISMVCSTGKGGTSYIAYSIITVYTNGEIIISGTDEYAGVDVMFLAAS